ncbi:hypothetical protein BJ322DRAFT_1213646 [Thelephora terrestris]|uniref:NB-ARC domain-containing protein n=1 Tax=Thelephora terrestris TaxID=56493 RepID=A0A9P6H6I0_9AGAM|nr:hypothetical protein BJ322DRAFT_1213646 [Thelephora terrestris]
MATNSSHLTEGRDRALSSLTASIGALNLAEQNSGIRPAKTVFGSAGVLLDTIRDSAANDQEYVKLGLSCTNVCRALDRGLNGRRTEDLSGYLLGAIETLTTTVATIQKAIIKQGKQGPASPPFHAKHDKEKIAAWERDLDRILLIFNTELAIDTHVMVAGTYKNVLAIQEGAHSVQARSATTNTMICMAPYLDSTPPGEFPPPAPKAFFGRGALIKEVVGHSEKLESIALIGAGGIGKSSIALTILDDDRIKARFRDNRRFIRCEQFLASCVHFLARLSKVIGAGVENPEDLTPLRPFLSSKEMIIVLDNAESILDPQATNHEEIYAVVNELCQFKTAAREIFYGIYGSDERSEIIDNLLQCLDFHALSITLLATAASDNVWDHDRLAKEWDEQRAQVLRTDHNESLAATIELSLASPTFRKLGPNARNLLGVVAFFPQGVGEKNLDWLFPTISDRANIFDNGFITMLAPIRDYFRPRDSQASLFICATKDHYFTRLSVDPDPDHSRSGETNWIVQEDVNVEHLLDIFTSIDTGAVNVWDTCVNFLQHLLWHKPQQTTLGTKIQGLPDGHPSKAKCLLMLALLSGRMGNYAEYKCFLIRVLKLERERGNDFGVAETLLCLSYANQSLRMYKEGRQQAKEALEMFEWLGRMGDQLTCLESLARSFLYDSWLDAAEDTVSRMIEVLPEKGQESHLCESHYLLGCIYRRKGEKEKAVDHFKTALTIAPPSNWKGDLFSIHYEMAWMFHDEGEFGEANTHIKQAKSHTAYDAYGLGQGMKTQAWIWYLQHRLGDARSEALYALEIYERLGVVEDVGDCQRLLQIIEQATEILSIPSESDSDGLDSDAYCTAPSTPLEDFQDFDRGSERVSHP